MTKKTIQIFRAGAHVASDGSKHVFTDADVQAIVGSYDPLLFSAPAVIGHPKSEDPAYGWADALRINDAGIVEADLDKVNPAFAELVEAGSYRKISSAFYPKDHPNNPTPGQFYLRHIGFLGAAAPGVSGLAPVAFAEGDDQVLEFTSEPAVIQPLIWLARLVGRMARRQRDQAIAEVGVDEANKLFPEWDQDAPADIVAELQKALPDHPRFSEAAPAGAPTITDASIAAAELASREAALADREAAQAARDLAFAEGQRTARLEEDGAWIDGLVDQGRFPPGLKSQVLGFCEALGESGAICFAEGEAAQDPRVAFKAMLDGGLGKIIHFEELAPGGGLKFAEGRTIDDLTAAIDAEMSAATAAGHPISASEASRRVKSRR